MDTARYVLSEFSNTNFTLKHWQVICNRRGTSVLLPIHFLLTSAILSRPQLVSRHLCLEHFYFAILNKHRTTTQPPIRAYGDSASHCHANLVVIFFLLQCKKMKLCRGSCALSRMSVIRTGVIEHK